MTPTKEAHEIFESFLKIVATNCESDTYCINKRCRYKRKVVCVTNISIAQECSMNAVKLLLEYDKRYLQILKALEKL